MSFKPINNSPLTIISLLGMAGCDGGGMEMLNIGWERQGPVGPPKKNCDLTQTGAIFRQEGSGSMSINSYVMCCGRPGRFFLMVFTLSPCGNNDSRDWWYVTEA